MKKIFPYILTLFCIFSIAFMGACNNNEVSIKFETDFIELNVGDEYDLNEKIVVKNVNKSDVKLKSLDSSVVSVIEGKAVAVGFGTTFVQAFYKDKIANLEIKVNSEAVECEAPLGLMYDEQNGYITWNHVLVKIGDEIQQVNSYTVEITSQNQISEELVIGDNKYFLEDSGEYSIRVKCNSFSSNQTTIYKGSNYSDSIELTKLEKPYNLTYNDETKTLSWQADDDIATFVVSINGVLSNPTSQKQMVVDLASKNINTQERYEVCVISNSSKSNKTGIVAKSASETKIWTRLYAPKLNIRDGEITWDNSQTGEFHYEITRTDVNGVQYKENVSGGKYSLNGIAAGTYNTLSIRAISDSEMYLSSENESTLTDVIKLDKATLSFDAITKTFSVLNFEGKQIELEITYKNSVQKVKLNNGQYQFTSEDVGTYSVCAYVYAQTDKEINSDVSNYITLVNLPKIDTSTINQSVVDNKYFVSFEQIENADTYSLSYVKNEQTNTLIKQNDNSYGDVDVLFKESGAYQIIITASSTKSVSQDMFILPSQTTITLVRQSDVVASLQTNENPTTITWDAISSANGYGYYITKNNEIFDESTTYANAISVENFSFGKYTFNIKALGSYSGGTLYLDSLNYAKIDFSIQLLLESPEVTFDRVTKILTVNKVKNATDYEISINSQPLVFDNSKQVITIDLSNKLEASGDYVVNVTAKNLADELIFDSNVVEIMITKLNSPQQFNLAQEGVLSILDYPNLQVLDSTKDEILINGKNTKTLDDSQQFNIKAKFLATLAADNNHYYLDSEYSQFTINRLSAPNKPSLNETIILWNATNEENFVYNVKITQNSITKTFEINQNNVNVFSEYFEDVDIKNNFYIQVQYKFKGSDINIGEQTEFYFTSNFSEESEIIKIESDITMGVTETDGRVVASWSESNLSDATYQLFLNEDNIYTGIENEYDITSLCEQAGVYTLRLKISKLGYLTSEYVEIYVERLESVNQISIDDNENIIVETDYTTETDDLENIAQLEKIFITDEESKEITNLSEYSGKFAIKVQLIAKTYTQGKYYYLSSDVSNFQFSRVQTLTNPIIMDNVISWDSIEGISSYKLKFSNGESDLYYVVTNATQISTKEEDINSILSQLNVNNNFTVSISAYLSNIKAIAESETLLSSYYSNESQIVKLSQVEDIEFESLSADQQELKISWTYSFEGISLKNFVVEIYKDSNLILTLNTSGQNNFVLTNELLDFGIYYASVYATGTNNFIDSEKSISPNYTRLNMVTNITANQEALLSWDGVLGAIKYGVSYYYNDSINGELETLSTTINLKEYLFANAFSGQVYIKVWAIGGNGQDVARTFSSKPSDNYVVTKPKEAEVVLYTDKLEIPVENWESDSIYAKSEFLITISTDNRAVKQLTLLQGEQYLFEDWYYMDTNEKVPTNVEKTYTIQIQRQLNNEDCIKSDVTFKTVIKLKEISNIGFIRKTTNVDDLIYLQGDVVNNASKYVAIIEGSNYQTNEFNVLAQVVQLPLTEQIYRAIPQQFTMTLYAQGMVNGQENYIDSSKVSISGKRLNQVANFKVLDGILRWDKVDLAYDYAINVNDTEILTGYVNDSNHTLYESLTGKAGDFVLNIKAVGNVNTSLIQNDVVLDSLYITDQSGIKTDYYCTKLEIPSNFKVVQGYLAFTKVSDATGYQVVYNNQYFNLTEVPTEQTEYSSMYSQEMYNAFKDNQQYSICARAISVEDDVLYSDSTNQINVRILSNHSSGTLKIQLKQTGVNPEKYDYTISQLVWDADSNAINGYNISFNNQIINTLNTEFVLDPDGNLSIGTYTIKLCVAGTSNVDAMNCYSLNSRYSEELSFTKMIQPTPHLEDGLLTWNIIEGATGYLLYLNDELQNSGLPIDNNYYVLNLSNSTNKEYSTYKVRAISTSSQYIASSVGVYQDQDNNPLPVVKLHAPDSFMVKDGALQWEINNIGSLGNLVDILNGIFTKPYTAPVNNINTVKIKIKLTNKTDNAEYTYEDYAINYCLVTEEFKQSVTDNVLIPQEIKNLILPILEEFEYNGWPTLNHGFLDMGTDLPAGSYNLTLSQNGDSTKYITSNYGSSMEVYVPYAPQISLIYSQNNYILSWDSINIPQAYTTQSPTYVIFADKNVQEDGKTVSIREIIGTTTQTNFNITELVENGTINSSYTALYVYVAGDNNKILNGKISNKITVSILNPTTAKVKDGELYWNAQEGASEYLITYTENNLGLVGETSTITLKDAKWDCAELESLDYVEQYTIKIQAVGLKVSTTTHAIITGPNSQVGSVSKLTTPQVEIEDGIFKWQSLAESSSYAIHVSNDESYSEEISIINQPDIDNNIWYESTFTLPNLLYRFQSIGSLDVDLTSGELAYVNSNKGNDTVGTTINRITNVVAKNGALYWDIAKNNNINISYYKLTFNKVNEFGNPINEDIVIKNNNFIDLSGNCVYDCADLSSGRYRVTIQAYYKNNDSLGTYQHNGQTAYYLMSVDSVEYLFQKYNAVQGEDESGVVYNIVLKDGEFSWKYVGTLPEENYRYELKFKINEEVTRELIVITEENSYYSYVTEKLINESPFELQIKVIPKEGVQDFVSSDYVTFKNPNNDNLPNIYQVNAIGQNDIVLRELREEDIENYEDVPSSDLHIIWNNYKVSTGNQNINIDVAYKIRFWTSEDPTVQSIVVNTQYVNTTLFQSTISDEYTLYYTIQVLPFGNQSYIPSYISDVREIKKPQSVESVEYNSEQKYFYWSTEGTSNDHTYRIKDEILEIDENGEIVLVDGKPNVIRTYIFTTLDNLTNTYTPVEQGMHLVSVAVVVKNSENEGSLTSDYTYYYDKVLEPDNKNIGTTVLIDLFKVTLDGSNGTVENPYLIENNEQFNNIKYRLEKDEYLNQYKLVQDGIEQTITLSKENQQFNFKQTTSIYNVQPLGNGSNFEFKGTYDGNKKTLSWDYDLSNISITQQIQYVALFSQISKGATIKNLKIIANISGELRVGATISLLCYRNYGTIQNVVLGSTGMQISLTSSKDMYFYGIAYQNFASGIIQNVANYYDVSIKSSTDVLGIRANYAGIVGDNEGIVLQCGNFGNILLQTTITTSGGIVGYNRTTGKVEASVLKNATTTLNIMKQGSTQVAVNFYFGGIAGQNDGSVNYSYAYTKSTIYRNASMSSTNNVYIAGLIGLSNNGNIKGCYVNNIINASTSQANLSIGNVQVFAYISYAPSGVNTQCFYNLGQTQSAVGGGGASTFTITGFSKVPQSDNLNGTESTYYLNNENEFPKFEWENEISNWVEQ